MLKRLIVAVLYVFAIALALALIPVYADEPAATPADGIICRRIYGTPEWTRRCLPQRPDESLEQYCRRIYGTVEWTRRCLQLLTPTSAVRPTQTVLRPTLTRPVEATPAPAKPNRP